ncbi:MAG: hypothetical protein A3F11_10625 [Gammaproteobacteria bacterium RIFCSPHIGHO2_12_FULL_37_14]|nr:MAG: hypothetical protein A3F11_10625 [Gammaproteobacteria bacterium RIFCSPHIGHO2_12_FULL_37_14]
MWIACLVSVGGILYGYDIGVISGALLFIKNTIPMTDMQVGIIVGAVLAGSLIGTFTAGPIGDRYGRKSLIILSSFVFIVGVIFILYAHSFLMLLYARLLLGIGVGIVSVAVPLYVAEIVPAKSRGKYVTFFQLLLTFGIVLAYFMDLIFTPSGNWRAMFAIVLIPALLLFIGMLFLPETPRWLIAHQRDQKAREILLRIHPTSTIDDDIEIIKNNFCRTKKSWLELFKNHQYQQTAIAVFVAVFNQLTGINAFLQYAPLVLKNAGLGSNFVTMLGSFGIGILNFICTMVAMILIDRIGRRPLLLIGVLGVFGAEIYLGLTQYLFAHTLMSGVLSLIGLFAFIIFFAIGPGVVVWLTLAELFPTHIRGQGMSFCLFLNSLASTLLATFFLPLSKMLGMTETYWLFAGLSFVYFIVVYFYLPETKMKSLEDIQQYFHKKNKTLVIETQG